MNEIVLLQKTYDQATLKKLGEYLEELCAGLQVKLANLNNTENNWVKILVSGEDRKAALNLLKKEIGLAPVYVRNVQRFSVLRGQVMLSKSKVMLFLDVGIFMPKPMYGVVPLRDLQSQLVDGRKFALKRIVDLFGLRSGIPLEIRVTRISSEEFEGELTERQLSLFDRWIDSRVDRLVVLGMFLDEVRENIHSKKLNRYVSRVNSLGVLEHALTCKLGVSGVRILRELRSFLPEATFVLFSPQQILEAVS